MKNAYVMGEYVLLVDRRNTVVVESSRWLDYLDSDVLIRRRDDRGFRDAVRWVQRAVRINRRRRTACYVDGYSACMVNL